MVHSIPASGYPGRKKGTKITIKGWAKLQSINRDFKIDKLERYLRYGTVLGYTKDIALRKIPFPQFSVGVGSQSKVLTAGFPYITEDPTPSAEGIKTVVFGPIDVDRKTHSGKTVKVTLKGGITTETGKFQLTEETGGVWLSVAGIPYFKLTTNKYAKRLNMTDDFVRFVAECDDVRLNLSRSDFNYDENFEAFEDALSEAFSRIKQDPKFQKFYQNKNRELRIELQVKMNMKKKEFQSEDKKYVWFKNKMLIAEPESEYDTAALLWILRRNGGFAI